MRKISFSTWLLVGLAALTVALSATLLILTPQEKLNELWMHHGRYYHAGTWNPAAEADAGNNDTYIRRGYRYMGPHGRPAFVVFPFIIMAVVFIGGRFLFLRRRFDASLPILEELFAEGKIDEAEFTRRRSVLNGSRGEEK